MIVIISFDLLNRTIKETLWPILSVISSPSATRISSHGNNYCILDPTVTCLLEKFQLKEATLRCSCCKFQSDRQDVVDPVSFFVVEFLYCCLELSRLETKIWKWNLSLMFDDERPYRKVDSF